MFGGASRGDRLVGFERGTLSGGSMVSKVRGAECGLTQTGNWAGYRLDANGDGDYSDTGGEEVDQSRAHNKVNEIFHATYGSAITELANQPAWIDPKHDAAGNAGRAAGVRPLLGALLVARCPNWPVCPEAPYAIMPMQKLTPAVSGGELGSTGRLRRRWRAEVPRRPR